MAKSSHSKTKLHCNSCRRRTKHVILRVAVTNDYDILYGDYRFDWQIESELVQCCGCDYVRLRQRTITAEEPEDPSDWRYYPPSVSRTTPDWARELPDNLRELLREVYSALHADSRRLAMMGLRAVVDMLLNDKVGDHGTFDASLNEFENRGFLASQSRKVLEAALEAGHAAAHRGHLPSEKELNSVMDIVENAVQAAYPLKTAAKKLDRVTPKRKLAKKKGSSKVRHRKDSDN